MLLDECLDTRVEMFLMRVSGAVAFVVNVVATRLPGCDDEVIDTKILVINLAAKQRARMRFGRCLRNRERARDRA